MYYLQNVQEFTSSEFRQLLRLGVVGCRSTTWDVTIVERQSPLGRLFIYFQEIRVQSTFDDLTSGSLENDFLGNFRRIYFNWNQATPMRNMHEAPPIGPFKLKSSLESCGHGEISK